MIKWLGLENYDNLSFDMLVKLKVDGLIVGAPFCSYRMFKYGYAGLLDFIKKANEFEIKIIYQTPVYVTDRNFKSVTNTIDYLYSELQVKKYLVQDIGLAEWIKQRYYDVDLIWSHWGRNRNSIMNHDFISFLIELGIKGIETNSKERIEAISKFGLSVYSVYGNTMYNTVSRECYNQYMLNRFDNMCKRECLNNFMFLKSRNIEMTIDGHLLGRRIKYPSDNDFCDFAAKFSDNLMIYALDYNEAVSITETL